jgi:hypothetical protein
MTPDRQRLRPLLNVTPPKPAGPQPTAADRLCANMMIARLNRVADQPDQVIIEAAALAVMELRHTITNAAHAAFLEKQLELDNRLRKAARAFLHDLRAAGGPDDRPPDFGDQAQADKFVELLAELTAALEAEVKAP